MTDINPEKIELDKQMDSRNLDESPIELLEKIKVEGRAWRDLREQYGVAYPDPPWRNALECTCDALANGDTSPLNICRPAEESEEVDRTKIDPIERRWEEDKLVEEHYAEVPFPERQLLALAHSMIRRGIINEDELAKHMETVDKRLHMV